MLLVPTPITPDPNQRTFLNHPFVINFRICYSGASVISKSITYYRMWHFERNFFKFCFCTTLLASGSNLSASWFSLPGLALQCIVQKEVPRFSSILVWTVILGSLPALVVEFTMSLVGGFFGFESCLAM